MLKIADKNFKALKGKQGHKWTDGKKNSSREMEAIINKQMEIPDPTI